VVELVHGVGSSSTEPAVVMSRRIVALDGLRGWALLWMFASHADIVWLGDRWFPNGWGFMVFVVVSGSLVRRFRWWPWVRLVLAAGLVGVLLMGSGLNRFTVLHAWVVALPLVALVAEAKSEGATGRRGLFVLSLAAVLSWTLVLPGVSPWAVTFGGLGGHLIGADRLGSGFKRLWCPRPVVWLGRRPLRAYVIHAGVIGLLVRVL
jgi:uncharacterized membrane protein